MEVKIYSCEKDSMLFVVIPATASLNDLPDQIKEVTGKLTLFKEMNLLPDAPLIGVNPNKALSDIEKKGYHVSKAKISVNEE
jgi:uncharacterized protein YcgL (UPF0745 family)